jgi:hypothetical protein
MLSVSVLNVVMLSVARPIVVRLTVFGPSAVSPKVAASSDD